MAVILLAAVPSFASTTVDKGLGLYEYSWFIDGLESYVFENPYYISQYKNRAFAERAGASDGQNMGGIYFSPLSWLTVGMYLGNPVNDTIWNGTERESLFNIDNYSVKGIQMTNSGTVSAKHSTATTQSMLGYQLEMLDGAIIDLTDPSDGSALVGTSTSSSKYRNPLNQQNVNLSSSFDFGRWGLGINFAYASSWANKRTGDATTSSNDEYDFVNTQYSTALGFFAKFNDKVSMDADLTLIKYSLSNSYEKTTPGVYSHMFYGDDGAMDIGFGTRLNYQMTASHRVHFNLKYQYINHSTKGLLSVKDTDSTNNVYGTDSFKRTGQDIQFGVSDEFKIGQDTKAFAGFNSEVLIFANAYSGKDMVLIGKSLNKYSRNSTIVRVPLIVGLESKLSENWTGRFGVVQTIYQPVTDSGKNTTNMGSITTPTNISDNSTSSTVLNMGASYKLGNFIFDWLASVDLLVSGPYMISGKTWTSGNQTPMALAFAATYYIDGLPSSEPAAAAEPIKSTNPARR
jgi:hypothetical protein